FIALPGIEASENSLRDCLRSLKNDLDRAIQAKTQAEKSLSDSWADEGKPGVDYLSWAKDRAKGNETALKTSAAHAKELIDGLEKAQNAVDSLGDSIKGRIDAEGKFQKAEQAIKDLDKAGQESELVDLLTAAEIYIPKSSRQDECPLCERDGIRLADLLKRIAVRLSEMKRTILLKKELDAAKKALDSAVTVAAKNWTALVESVRALASALRESKLSEAADLKLDWPQFPNVTASAAPGITDEIVREAQKFQIAAKAGLNPIKKKHETDTKALNQLRMIQRAVAAVEDNTKKVLDLDKRSKRAEAILAVIEAHRKEFVSKILDDISKEVGDLCEKIHPGEGIKIQFFLKPNTKGSLESLSEFEGVSGVPPQAYYSESHLDTIGVCIFLALAKRFGGENTIIVLDDVVTSVDAPHMERFINMLMEEAAHFSHLIAATHYRPWLERFRHARGPSANVQLIHLAPWSLARGVRAAEAKLAAQELKDAAAALPFDRQAAASKAGIFLESILDQLALLYGCKVARKPEPVYTLGELLDCFDKKLKALLKCEIPVEGGPSKAALIGPMLDGLAAFTWIRNQVGAHWNPAGFDIPDADVLKFAQKTVELSDSLICAKCGSLPTKNKTGTHWQCRCTGESCLKMTPLESPEN
ncbi:MAG: hypothetical protein AAB091_07100, partial [Elusimicrobiota bacterium]